MFGVTRGGGRVSGSSRLGGGVELRLFFPSSTSRANKCSRIRATNHLKKGRSERTKPLVKRVKFAAH